MAAATQAKSGRKRLRSESPAPQHQRQDASPSLSSLVSASFASHNRRGLAQAFERSGLLSALDTLPKELARKYTQSLQTAARAEKMRAQTSKAEGAMDIALYKRAIAGHLRSISKCTDQDDFDEVRPPALPKSSPSCSEFICCRKADCR